MANNNNNKSSNLWINNAYCCIFLICVCMIAANAAGQVPDETTLVSHHHHRAAPSHIHRGGRGGRAGRRGVSLTIRNKWAWADNDMAPSMTRIYELDRDRVDSIQAQLDSNSRTARVHAGTTIGTGNYVVQVEIGSHKEKLWLVMDTGSGLTWVQVEECNPCFFTKNNFHDKLSKTFKQYCSPPEGKSRCPAFQIKYGDGFMPQGTYAQDWLSLGPGIARENYIFGAATHSDHTESFNISSGILGLAREEQHPGLSALDQFGFDSFTYSLPTSTQATGTLTFNPPASEMMLTKMILNGKHPTKYFIELEEITINKKPLNLKALWSSDVDRTILDSGTTITFLPAKVYDALKTEFDQKMKAQGHVTNVTSPKPETFNACYKLTKNAPVPNVRLHFAKLPNEPATEILIGLQGLFGFDKQSGISCLNIAPLRQGQKVAIIGNAAQLNYEVLHDIRNGHFGFRHINNKQ